jgi:hypothetical protein
MKNYLILFALKQIIPNDIINQIIKLIYELRKLKIGIAMNKEYLCIYDDDHKTTMTWDINSPKSSSLCFVWNDGILSADFIPTNSYDGTLIMEKYQIEILSGYLDSSNKFRDKCYITIKKLAIGGNHSLLLTRYGDLFIWGKNNFGQLGVGDNYNYLTPHQLPYDDINSISAGYYHSLFIKKYCLYTWGYNSYGQLGLGDDINKNKPSLVYLDSVITAVCGFSYSVAITTSGLFVWGSNDCAQLGLGDYACKHTPTLLNIKPIISIKCSNSSMALTSNGELWTWGFNHAGGNIRIPKKLNIAPIINFDYGKYSSVLYTIHDEVFQLGTDINNPTNLLKHPKKLSVQRSSFNYVILIIILCIIVIILFLL